MSVEFLGEGPSQTTYADGTRRIEGSKGITGYIIEKGVVENESQARIFLLGIATLMFSLSIFVTFKEVLVTKNVVLSSEELLTRQKSIQANFPHLP